MQIEHMVRTFNKLVAALRAAKSSTKKILGNASHWPLHFYFAMNFKLVVLN